MSLSEKSDLLVKEPSAGFHSLVGGSLAGNSIEKCIKLFSKARGSLMEAALSLYDIKTNKKWRAQFSSFNEFLLELQIDPAQASRLCSVVEHYIVQGGIEPTQISDHSPEKLYRAMRLPLSPIEQALRASTWTTQELRAELSRKENGDEHTCEAIQICKTCGRRM